MLHTTTLRVGSVRVRAFVVGDFFIYRMWYVNP